MKQAAAAAADINDDSCCSCNHERRLLQQGRVAAHKKGGGGCICESIGDEHPEHLIRRDARVAVLKCVTNNFVNLVTRQP